MHAPAEAAEIVEAFLTTPFSDGERHSRRIDRSRTSSPPASHPRSPQAEPSMPEGHTTHRLAAQHQRCYGGSQCGFPARRVGFAAAAAVLDGLVLQRAEAHGKHLFHVYRSDLVVHIHLGLYGAFTDQTLPVQPPRGQVRMRLVGSTHWTDLRGPTACELLTEDRGGCGARPAGTRPAAR